MEDKILKTEERTFKLSLEKAKMWYNGSSQDLKRIALEVYSEEELTKVELPNSWKEFFENQPSFIQSRITEELDRICFDERCQALRKLKYLRNYYRQGWIPDWNDGNSIKYCIGKYAYEINKNSYIFVNKFLSFQSSEIRDKFLENFKDLIKEADDLI